MQHILRGTALNKYKQVLAECKESDNDLAEDQWNLGATKDVTMEQFWDWAKVDSIDGSGDLYLGLDRCRDSEKDL